MSNTNVNVEGLEKLLKALKAKPPQARVGILGAKVDRTATTDTPDAKSTSDTSTNAEIGAAHEFGAPARGIPQRSFLRIPITERLQKEMQSSGALDKKVLAEVVESGSVVPWLKKIAVLAEGIVADAFATGGFGKWPAWKTKGYENNTGQLLIDTQQLRNSITSEVKE